ncbi:hypothetical protein [Poseidonibacter ostreae]|uniref:Uncharacterized protein n=1 Tax=Poseidonibacter ostreae TaxID=2654171 RepID=A0A6L4WP81_9BACT|nr:hypothetical protein [Poseidonibacter ostreae]KAB7884620.1 hypothetical protein GA417_10995 [Poseidonibacter ostreae]KAB7885713.1 hypothetical protein GBG19_13505 [Poseidonibacter ostreae]KAB7887911.1 hypothetical protein GBG18_13550 [Poseidonibacter ostreae]
MSLKNDILFFKSEVLSILNTNEKMEYEGSSLYFLNQEKFLEIYKLYEAATKTFNESKLSRKAKDPFFQIAKLFGDKENQIIAYKLYIKHKYKNITDKEKVKHKIDAIHSIEINKINNNLAELIKNTNDNYQVTKLKKEADKKIKSVIEKKEFLLKDFENLDIVISTFKKKDTYPTIKVINTKQEAKIEHLRLEVPNIINTHNNMFVLDEDNLRKNAKHIKFLLEAEHAFADIFFKKK